MADQARNMFYKLIILGYKIIINRTNLTLSLKSGPCNALLKSKYCKISSKGHVDFRKIKKVDKWVTFCYTLGGGVDLGLGITYEELCIKFSSILMGPKKFYRHFKKKFSEKLKISVILEGKLMENLVLYFQFLIINTKNFMIFQLQNYLQIFAFSTDFVKNLTINDYKKKLKTHKEPCIKFSIFELQPYKKIDSVENWFCVKIPVFPSFFFVFLDFFENCWKMFTFYLYNAPRIFTFTSEITPIV
ncbi:hypothetical protein AGLY_008759 [Aphis glycines]|uniref:Uncharacterized protein n=1 Tax=Aphis glycines TaxID=307491 RepID=A0A6G0TJI2_APHGL|nr:hypothetical protein AGLY_008759 [Aphis glycines]